MVSLKTFLNKLDSPILKIFYLEAETTWFLEAACHKVHSKGSEVKSFSHVQLFATPWTVACQAPLSMGFSRQEYWSGLPFPSPKKKKGKLRSMQIKLRSMQCKVKINANKIETTVSSSGKLSNSTQYIQYQSMIGKFPIYSELSN